MNDQPSLSKEAKLTLEAWISVPHRNPLHLKKKYMYDSKQIYTSIGGRKVELKLYYDQFKMHVCRCCDSTSRGNFDFMMTDEAERICPPETHSSL